MGGGFPSTKPLPLPWARHHLAGDLVLVVRWEEGAATLSLRPSPQANELLAVTNVSAGSSATDDFQLSAHSNHTHPHNHHTTTTAAAASACLPRRPPKRTRPRTPQRLPRRRKQPLQTPLQQTQQTQKRTTPQRITSAPQPRQRQRQRETQQHHQQQHPRQVKSPGTPQPLPSPPLQST